MINLAEKWVAIMIIGIAFAFAAMIGAVAWAESSKAESNKPYIMDKDGKQVVCIYDIREWKCE